MLRGSLPHGAVVVLEKGIESPVARYRSVGAVDHHGRRREVQQLFDLRRHHAWAHDYPVEALCHDGVKRGAVYVAGILHETDTPVVSIVDVVEDAGELVSAGDSVYR